MYLPNKLFKHNNGTTRPVRWFDFEAFNQWTEEIITKCDIFHRRLNSVRVCENANRATLSDATKAAPVAPASAHITAHVHYSSLRALKH